jgi:hypothetical protein
MDIVLKSILRRQIPFLIGGVITGATATNADTLHTCSRQHTNEYVTVDYMDWS